MSTLLFVALFLVAAACGDDPVKPPDPFDLHQGPLVNLGVRPGKINEGDQVELTFEVWLSCHRQQYSSFDKDVMVYFAARRVGTGGVLAQAEEGVDYTVELKPLALPAYTTRKTMQIPIKALADDQEEGDERLTFVVDRIVDADGDHLEFWGPGPRQVWYSIRIEEGG